MATDDKNIIPERKRIYSLITEIKGTRIPSDQIKVTTKDVPPAIQPVKRDENSEAQNSTEPIKPNQNALLKTQVRNASDKSGVHIPETPTQTQVDEKPVEIAPKTEVTPDDQVKELISFDQLYGGYKGEPSIKDYTPEEKAKLEKEAKKARWSDAAIVLGRALQGKDMQLDKTRSSEIRNKLEARTKEYMAAVERNNQNKAAWDMNRNQEQIRWYQKQLERQDLSDAKKQEYELKKTDLENEKKRLDIMRDEFNAKKDAGYFKKDKSGKQTNTQVSAAITDSYKKLYPNYTQTAKTQIAQAIGGKDYSSANKDEYAMEWLESFSDGKGGYEVPTDVVNKINTYLQEIDALAIEVNKKTPGASAKMREKKKELASYIVSTKGQKSTQPTQATSSGAGSANSVDPSTLPPAQQQAYNKYFSNTPPPTGN